MPLDPTEVNATFRLCPIDGAHDQGTPSSSRDQQVIQNAGPSDGRLVRSRMLHVCLALVSPVIAQYSLKISSATFQDRSGLSSRGNFFGLSMCIISAINMRMKLSLLSTPSTRSSRPLLSSSIRRGSQKSKK